MHKQITKRLNDSPIQTLWKYYVGALIYELLSKWVFWIKWINLSQYPDCPLISITADYRKKDAKKIVFRAAKTFCTRPIATDRWISSRRRCYFSVNQFFSNIISTNSIYSLNQPMKITVITKNVAWKGLILGPKLSPLQSKMILLMTQPKSITVKSLKF